MMNYFKAPSWVQRRLGKHCHKNFGIVCSQQAEVSGIILYRSDEIWKDGAYKRTLLRSSLPQQADRPVHGQAHGISFGGERLDNGGCGMGVLGSKVSSKSRVFASVSVDFCIILPSATTT